MDISSGRICPSSIYRIGIVAEWLRREIRNLLGSPAQVRVLSMSPFFCFCFVAHVLFCCRCERVESVAGSTVLNYADKRPIKECLWRAH